MMKFISFIQGLYENIFEIIMGESANYSLSETFRTVFVCEIWNCFIFEMCYSGCSFFPFITANQERSNLYLKLFKLVFGSVSLFANENEQMLKVWIY